MFAVPDGVSDRISEILEVLFITRVNAKREDPPVTPSSVTRARRRAISAVAASRNIDVTTVSNKYRRELKLPGGTPAFDGLLFAWLRDDAPNLRWRLEDYASSHSFSQDMDAISEFFDDAQRADYSIVSDEAGDSKTLDDIVPDGTDTLNRWTRLNIALAGYSFSFERIKCIVERTIRHDTPLVRALKEAAGHRCQFPGCGVGIPRPTASPYVEVHHIKAVSQGGASVLGNLLVLCPNHHKEFEFNQPQISHQSLVRVSGSLNGVEFDIRYPGMA